MKIIRQTNIFKKDLKRSIKRGRDIKKLYQVVEILVSDRILPANYRAHKLVGNYGTKSECHIEPDWLLIYEVTQEVLVLYRCGTHADLFD